MKVLGILHTMPIVSRLNFMQLFLNLLKALKLIEAKRGPHIHHSILPTDVTLKHWVKKYGWRDDGNLIFIANQDENIKTKNITEKIEFDHLAPLMALL